MNRCVGLDLFFRICRRKGKDDKNKKTRGMKKMLIIESIKLVEK